MFKHRDPGYYCTFKNIDIQDTTVHLNIDIQNTTVRLKKLMKNLIYILRVHMGEIAENHSDDALLCKIK